MHVNSRKAGTHIRALALLVSSQQLLYVAVDILDAIRHIVNIRQLGDMPIFVIELRQGLDSVAPEIGRSVGNMKIQGSVCNHVEYGKPGDQPAAHTTPGQQASHRQVGCW